MASIRFGRRTYGRSWVFGGRFGTTGGGGGETTVTTARPGEYAVKIFNADGTKLAEWGSGVANNPITKLMFALDEHGCAECELTLGARPADTVLAYGMRLDIHLFGDVAPWYSGYVTDRPAKGSTVRPYVYKGYGFYQQLSWVLVNSTYENMDVSTIAKSIVQTVVEPDTHVIYASSKVISVGYMATKLRFDYVLAADAIKSLAEFATGYVYGVDERREFFFRPLKNAINEQARLYVGTHINSFTPTDSIADLVNYALIKSGELDSGGSNIAATVFDSVSIAAYGLRKKVLEIPSALTDADATRWGTAEIDRLKNPTTTAKITGLKLDYPNADGSYNVRRIKPDGKAVITDLDGTAHELPISKVKYTISKDGIVPEITLGTPEKTMQSWYVKLFRDYTNNKYLQELNNKQLSGGSV